MRFKPLQSAPILTSLLMLGPILAGLAGVLLPAFGWLPVLGGARFTLDPIVDLLATPGLGKSVALSLASGLVTTLCAMLMVIGLLSAWSDTPPVSLDYAPALTPIVHPPCRYGSWFCLSFCAIWLDGAHGFARPLWLGKATRLVFPP